MLKDSEICWKFSRSFNRKIKKKNNADSVKKEWTVTKEGILETAKEHIGTIEKENVKSDKIGDTGINKRKKKV